MERTVYPILVISGDTEWNGYIEKSGDSLFYDSLGHRKQWRPGEIDKIRHILNLDMLDRQNWNIHLILPPSVVNSLSGDFVVDSSLITDWMTSHGVNLEAIRS